MPERDQLAANLARAATLRWTRLLNHGGRGEHGDYRQCTMNRDGAAKITGEASGLFGGDPVVSFTLGVVRSHMISDDLARACLGRTSRPLLERVVIISFRLIDQR